jgi:Sodium/hydrogen exchanger family
MAELSLSNLVAVVAVAFAVPLLLGLVPWLRLPSVVGEIVAGIVLGPSLLGWVEVDLPLQVLAVLGLAFLLFLAGLEIDLHGLRRGGLLALLVLVAERLGLELILGAFLAGAVLRVVDRDQAMTHPRFRMKLEAVGFGLLVPVFFVVSGLRFDLAALTDDAGTLRLVPLFAVALLVVRGCRRCSTGAGSAPDAPWRPPCSRRPRCRSSSPPPRSASTLAVSPRRPGPPWSPPGWVGAAVPAAGPDDPARPGPGGPLAGQRRQSRNACSRPAIVSGGTASTVGRPARRMTVRICSR